MSFCPDVPQATRNDIRERMAGLGRLCGGEGAGILHWQADWNLDQRKGYQLMQLGVFANEAAYQQYRTHPAHIEFAEAMSHIADWVVGGLAGDWRPSSSSCPITG